MDAFLSICSAKIACYCYLFSAFLSCYLWQTLVPEEQVKYLTTFIRDLHAYYMAQTKETDEFGFEAIIRPPLVFCYEEEVQVAVG